MSLSARKIINSLILIVLNLNVFAQDYPVWSAKANSSFFINESKTNYVKYLDENGSTFNKLSFNVEIMRSLYSKPKWSIDIGIKTMCTKFLISGYYSEFNLQTTNDFFSTRLKGGEQPSETSYILWDFQIANQFNRNLPSLFNHRHFIEGRFDFSVFFHTRYESFSNNGDGIQAENTVDFIPSVGFYYNYSLMNQSKKNNLYVRLGINKEIRQIRSFYLYNSYWSVGLNYRWAKTKKEAIE